MHVDLAINGSPLMALRTRRKPFSLENPRGEISIVNLGRGGGVGRAKSAKKMDGAGHERDERLQDVQLSPRFERNGLRSSAGRWLLASSPVFLRSGHHRGFRPPEFDQISRGSLAKSLRSPIKREGNNSRCNLFNPRGIRVSSGGLVNF